MGGELARALRRWWPVLALGLLLAALQSRLWFGDGGLPEARALQESVREQREENARLEQRNDALGAEVEDLKSGETAVEERARSELGMIRPGETFYRVVEPNPGAAAAVPSRPATAPTDATGNAPALPVDEAAAETTDAPPALPEADADVAPAAPPAVDPGPSAPPPEEAATVPRPADEASVDAVEPAP